MSARRRKAATNTIPVLLYAGADPVGAGTRTGFKTARRQVHGVSTYTSELGPGSVWSLPAEFGAKATKIATVNF